jgi:hypothetical protein
MEFLREALIVVHFVGLAALFGGFFVQMTARDKVINTAMLHGVITQLVTGLLLVGINEGLDRDVDNAKVGVKLLITAVVAVLVISGRRRPTTSVAVWATIGGLTLVNIIIAVFWR